MPTFVMTPRVPSEPMNMCFKWYPVLSFLKRDIRSSTVPSALTCFNIRMCSINAHIDNYNDLNFCVSLPLLAQEPIRANFRISTDAAHRHWSKHFHQYDTFPWPLDHMACTALFPMRFAPAWLKYIPTGTQ